MQIRLVWKQDPADLHHVTSFDVWVGGFALRVTVFVSLSEFRQALALAAAKRRDHQRKSGEKSSNISNMHKFQCS